MKCPNCAAEADAAAECPSCGLIFTKWREARKKEAQEAVSALEKPSPNVDPRQHQVLMAVAVTVAVAWMIFLAIYYYQSLSHIKRRLPARAAPLAPAAPIMPIAPAQLPEAPAPAAPPVAPVAPAAAPAP